MSKRQKQEIPAAASTLTAAQRTERTAWAGLAVAILVVALIRIRLAPAPLERDEGEYAYAGQLILQGVLPFVEVYNMKMPGIYAAYAVVLALFGQTPFGIHIGLLVVNVLSTVLLFAIVRRYMDPIASLIAAVSFLCFTLNSGVLGAFAHATHFVVFFGLAGFCVLLRPAKVLRWYDVLGAGLLFGCAFMMKQHAAPFVAVAGGYLFWRLRAEAKNSVGVRAALLTLFLAGVFLPFLVTCGAMWGAGVFDKFWFWTFEYAGAYVSKNPFARIPRNFGGTLVEMVPAVFFLWCLSLVGFGAMWKRRRVSIFLLACAVAGALAISPGFYFRQHYFVLVLPLASVLAALGAEWIAGRAPLAFRKQAGVPAMALMVAAVAWAQYALADRAYLFTRSPVEVSRALYGANPFPESIEIARYLHDNTTPEDRIAIIGSEPQLSFYSQRRSASGFAYIYPLMEEQRFASQMQQQMIEEIESRKPKYVVLVMVQSSWSASQNSDPTFFNWAQDYINKRCDRVGVVKIGFPESTFYWGDAQKGISLVAAQPWVGIFRLRESG
ncbi:MAG: glycosyltransferase family 39 protein [Candidatus Hydrogenedentes bacterium]|nr:glycosyltransferase family 39 protein [Candidatus Hydrogenedentota bacterium]